MSLRPQFSLRTLLLVTALIALGAKLWHGPYHVVETIDGVEHEYDYYRTWKWERVKHGVVIERGSGTNLFYQSHSAEKITMIGVWRHHQDSGHVCILRAYPQLSDSGGIWAAMDTNGLRPWITHQLTEQEDQQFQAAIRREIELLNQQGYDDVREDLRSNDNVTPWSENIEPEPTPDNDPKGGLL